MGSGGRSPSGYHALVKRGGVVPVACWMHVRRYFFDAFSGGDIDAAVVLTLIQRLYRVEAEAKERRFDAAALLDLRNGRSRPEIERIALVLEHLAKDALPKSPIGGAVSYTRTLWPHLVRFLADPTLPLDNGGPERAIRAVAIGRKN